MKVSDITLAPWHRHIWYGELISIDDTPTTDFTEDDVVEVLVWAATDDTWDGYAVGIVRLVDGRVVGWEAMWGPTGDGFSYGAYGGEADILFAASQDRILRYLTERGKEVLRDYLVYPKGKD